MKEFKISAHSTGEIMAGNIGLTDVQELRIQELTDRNNGIGKPLTENMKKELSILIFKRDNPELPQGAKTYCKKWVKMNSWNVRNEDWKNVVIEKGLICEQEGIDLLNEIISTNYEKNESKFDNEFMQGTPDIITPDIIRDIKNSWDLMTFPMFEDEIPNEQYWWQLQTYMAMTGVQKASLDYVLIDTPMPLVLQDLKNLYYQSGGKSDEWNVEKYESLFHNYRFDDVPKEKRIKSYTFNYESGIEEKIIERVKMCRIYINQLISK